MPDFRQLAEQIDQAMRGDRFRLRKLLQSIQSAARNGKPHDRNLAKLSDQLSRSVEVRRQRLTQLPPIRYDDQLPITAWREAITDAIRQHQVVVVCGETGSGKSTQLPKICLEMGRGIDGLIGHTQPRRIAARSVASRLAEELQSSLGNAVGFKIRFTDKTSSSTYIKLMTDGILLAESQQDRRFERYDTIIVDEAHERSLNIDFLLGCLKRVLPQRPDLRVVITSATIDAERFCRHFGDEQQPAPLIEVSGRSYPVDIRYRPLDEEEDDDDGDQQQAILAAYDELASEGDGDILVFLPTEREIRETARRLRGHVTAAGNRGGGNVEILPLYARLSTAEQNRVFQAHRGRRVVLATNVAESSLTVPGIRYVIDTGTARISRYAARSKVQRLPIEAVSRASADQRAGRCGRVAPGICIRLYGQDDYEARDRFTTPEIRRTNLAAVILQTQALQLGAIDQFPFLDPPNPEAIRDGYRTLFELGAIDDHRRLTDLGRELSRLPTDPRIARIILAADVERCLADVLIIAAALEVQDPRERPPDRQKAADECHAKWAHEASDFMTLLNLWDFYEKLKSDLSRNQVRKACRQNFLNSNRMREWQDVHRQLRELVEGRGMRLGRRTNDYDCIHRALLTGLLSNVAMRGDGNEYTGAGGKKFFLWPGSSVFSELPKWIVAAELVETTRRYARTIARVQPQWIEPLAEHLVKHSYRDPHWHEHSGSAMAFEKVTLFGLPLVANRRAPYGPIDPPYSRELLIREGLVAGQISWTAPFLQRNRELIEQIETEAAKSRSRDLIVDNYHQINFYNARVPDDVYDVARLRKWWKSQTAKPKRTSGKPHDASQPQPDPLVMTRQDLLDEPPEVDQAESFPDHLSIDGMDLKLDYNFQPGADDDGMTLTVPRDAVGRLSDDQLDWLVPGLQEEKILALIRSLPKSIRRNLVPAPETARQVTEQLADGEGPFLPRVCALLSDIAQEPIRESDFQRDKLPRHLTMNVRVVAADGEPLAESRDLGELREQLGTEMPGQSAEIDDSQWRRDQLTRWDFGPLPKQVEVPRNDVAVPGYPALLDRGQHVDLRLLDSREKANLQNQFGLRRLFVLAAGPQLREQVDWIPQRDGLAVLIAPICSAAKLTDALAELIADRAFLWSRDLPRDESQFAERLKQGGARIPGAAQEVTRWFQPFCEHYQQARLALEEAPAESWAMTVADVTAQIERLTHDEFLTRVPWRWLSQYPRYLEAIHLRLDKRRHGAASRDDDATVEMQHLEARWLERLQQNQQQGVYDPELEMYRWMLEEYRVSLFAQELGTAISVSAKKLDKQWAKVD